MPRPFEGLQRKLGPFTFLGSACRESRTSNPAPFAGGRPMV